MLFEGDDEVDDGGGVWFLGLRFKVPPCGELNGLLYGGGRVEGRRRWNR